MFSITTLSTFFRPLRIGLRPVLRKKSRLACLSYTSLISFSSITKQEWQETWKSTINKNFSSEKDKVEIINVCKTLLQNREVITDDPNRDNKIASLYARCGDILAFQGNLSEGLKNMEMAKEILVNSKQDIDKEQLMIAYYALSNMYYLMKNWEVGVKLNESAISFHKKLGLKNTIKHADALEQAAIAYIELFQYPKAKDTIDEALRILLELNEKDHYRLINYYGVRIGLDMAFQNWNEFFADVDNVLGLTDTNNPKKFIVIAKTFSRLVYMGEKFKEAGQSDNLVKVCSRIEKILNEHCQPKSLANANMQRIELSDDSFQGACTKLAEYYKFLKEAEKALYWTKRAEQISSN